MNSAGSHKPYPAYKDSGVQWLGDVPEGWEVSKLGFHASVKARLGWKGLKAEEYVDEGYIFLATPNIKGRIIDFENVNYISEERYLESPEIMLEVGDVLIAKDGSTLGITNVVRDLPAPSTVNSSIAVLRPHQKINSNFLYWLMVSNFTQSVIQKMKDGQGVPHLFQSDLRKFWIWTPPLPEQTAIAAFLDRETARIDALIAKKKRLIELLAEKRAAVISHAVTKGLDPDAPMKDSGVEWLGEAPAHWEVKRFSRIAFYQEGPGLRNWQFTSSGIRVICVTNITDQGIDFTNYEKFISNEEYKACYTHFTVQHGDLLLSSSGNSWGKVAEYVDIEPVILNTSTIRINEHPSCVVDKSYIALFLKSTPCREQLGLAMTGSCQPNFGPSHLSKVYIAYPPKDEQLEIFQSINSRLYKINKLLDKNQAAIAKLQEYRTALITAAVTGKIDVRGETGGDA